MVVKDTKPRFIQWLLLPQEFDFEVINREGTKNQVANHISTFKDEAMAKFENMLEINNAFPNERVLVASHDLIPWFADSANYLVSDVVPPNLTSYKHRKFISYIRKFSWNESYLFHVFVDGIIRYYILKVEMISILEACHSSLVGDIIVVFRQHITSYNVTTTSTLFTKMPKTTPKHVKRAKEKVEFPESISSYLTPL